MDDNQLLPVDSLASENVLDSTEPFQNNKQPPRKIFSKRLIVILTVIILIISLRVISLNSGGTNDNRVIFTPVTQPTGNNTDPGMPSEISQNNDPSFDLSGPTEGKTNSQLQYELSARAGSGVLTKVEMWVSKVPEKGVSNKWTSDCPEEIIDVFCRVKTVVPVKTAESTFSILWTPEAAGEYYISVNVYNSQNGACNGNFIGFTPGSKQCKSSYPYKV